MDEKTIKRGSLINAAGIAGKALLPLLFILISRLFGPKPMGIFFLGFVILDVAFSLTMSGIKDGISLFTSRYAINGGGTAPDTTATYRILANSLLLVLLVSAVIIGLFFLLAKPVILSRYPDGKLHALLKIMVWTIPLYTVPNLVAGAVRGLLLMHWEAILVGFLRPLLLCMAVLVVFCGGLGLEGLAWGYLFANAVLFVISIFAFARHFKFPELLAGFRRPFWHAEFLRFIIPQNLNMTFNTLIGNLDVLMLGYFRIDPALIGYYGMGAQIVRNIRQIKIAMAGIMGPVITRLHAMGNNPEVERLFNKTANWAVTIALPAVFLVGMFRSELLQIFHKSFHGDANFMLLLLVPPFLSCLMGMAGDIIVMTGHAAWNLANSVAIALLNLILSLLLIPVWQLEGAALSTLLSTSCVYLLVLIEVRYLFGIRLRREGLRPLLLLPVPGAAVLALYASGSMATPAGRVAASATGLLLYLLVYRSMKKRRAGISGT